jgi:riboflavin synthase alpha subunit
MFTGIIQDIGRIIRISKKGNSFELVINAPALTGKTNPGDSVAINGACLTVTSISGLKKEHFTFDAVPETIKRTTLSKLRAQDSVNIEPALRIGQPLGGHFVQGHIDDTGIISSIRKQGGEYLMKIKCPSKMIESIIEKGSIAIDGVSLTVASVESNDFTVAVIPFTLKHTTLGKKKSGDKVNIELDIIGKWVMKQVAPIRQPTYSDEGF